VKIYRDTAVLRRYVKKHTDFEGPAAKLIAAFEHGAASIAG
jgi:hypothetical protein